MMSNRGNLQVPGMPCPVCGNFIPTTITELLTANLHCPHCGLVLMVNRTKCATAMKALAKVAEAQKTVEQTSKFNQ